MPSLAPPGMDDGGLPRTEIHRQRARSAFVFGLAVLLSALGLGYLFSLKREPPNTERFAAVGDFPERHAWFNTQEPLSLYRELSGHVVLLLFSDFTRLLDAAGLERLQRLYEDLETSPVAVVTVFVSSVEDPDSWRATIAAWGIGFPVIVDHDGMVMTNFGVRETPQLVVLDAHARVVARYGAEWRNADLEGLISDLTAEGVASRALAYQPFRALPGEYVPPALSGAP